MKKILFITLLLISFSSYSQEYIEGIGVFKIDKTSISDVEKYLIDNNYDYINNIVDNEQTALISTQKNAAGKIGYSEKFLIYGQQCELAETIIISNIKIANFDIKMMKLIFYDSKLLSISFESTNDLNEAFEIKYGKPEMNMSEKVVKCQFDKSNPNKSLNTKLFTKSWINNKNKVLCTSYFGNEFNENCEETYRYSVHINKTNSTQKLIDCKKNSLERRIKKNNDLNEL